MIPKHHGEKLTDIPDDALTEILVRPLPPPHLPIPFPKRLSLTNFSQPVVKKLVHATGAQNYNILQNNGRIAHQEVDHVHFHLIPKPSSSPDQGLGIGWPQQATDFDGLKKLLEEIKSKM